MADKPRDYQKEYKKWHSSPEAKKNRAARNSARAKLEKEGKVHKNDGKDVDHVRGVEAGNGDSNLRVTSQAFNRGRNNNKGHSKSKPKKK